MSIPTFLRVSLIVFGLVGGAACNPWTLDGSPHIVALAPQTDGGVMACKWFNFRRPKGFEGGFDYKPLYESWLVATDGKSERFAALDCPQRSPSKGPFALAGGGEVRVEKTQGSPAAAIVVVDSNGTEVWRYEGDNDTFVAEPSGEYVFASVKKELLKFRLADGTAEWALTLGDTPHTEP